MILSATEIIDLVNQVYPTVFTNSEIPQKVLCGQIVQESSGNTNAFLNDSNGGSYGLMQIDQNVLKALGLDPNTNLNDATQNVTVGFTYLLAFYNGKFGNGYINNINDYTLKIAMTLLCYNCGPGNFDLLYKNHLSQDTNATWNLIMTKNSLISNWAQCLKYPCSVFNQSIQWFDLASDGTNTQYENVIGPIPILTLNQGQ